MNKRLLNAIVVALFGAYVVGFAVLVWWSSYYAAHKGPHPDQIHIQHDPFGDWITHDAAGFFTLLLVLVGLGQAGLFVWQLRYMRKSIEDARLVALAAQAAAETAKEQVAVTKMGIVDLERAYLAVGPTQIKVDYVKRGDPKNGKIHLRSDPKELRVKLYVHNTGRTGATIKKIFAEFSNLLPISETPIYGGNRVQPHCY
jgi:hypothetical protein